MSAFPKVTLLCGHDTIQMEENFSNSSHQILFPMLYMYCITLQEGISDGVPIVSGNCVAVDPYLNFVYKRCVAAQD